jgi:hypothetical protein
MQLKTVEQLIIANTQQALKTWRKEMFVAIGDEIDVVKQIVKESTEATRQDTITAVIEMVEGMRPTKVQKVFGDLIATARGHRKIDYALTDIITKLQALSPKE